jgi:hypothetical protein
MNLRFRRALNRVTRERTHNPKGAKLYGTKQE